MNRYSALLPSVRVAVLVLRAGWGGGGAAPLPAAAAGGGVPEDCAVKPRAKVLAREPAWEAAHMTAESTWRIANAAGGPMNMQREGLSEQTWGGTAACRAAAASRLQVRQPC